MLPEEGEGRETALLSDSDNTPINIDEKAITAVLPLTAKREIEDFPLVSRRLLRLFVRMGHKVLELPLPDSERLVIGRLSPNSPHTPNVDLTAYDALPLGVSRLHAIIEDHNPLFTLIDLYSSNGTLLNGRRMEPNEIRFIRDGDTICLGNLVLYVRIFETEDV